MLVCVEELEQDISQALDRAKDRTLTTTAAGRSALLQRLEDRKDKIASLLLSGSRAAASMSAVRDVNLLHSRYVDIRARVHQGMEFAEGVDDRDNLMQGALVEFANSLVDYPEDENSRTGERHREYVTQRENLAKKSDILPQGPHPRDYDVPTGRQTRSPTFGAKKFDQSLLICEELCPARLRKCVRVLHGEDQSQEILASGWDPAPAPVDARSAPFAGAFLENANEHPGLLPDKFAATSTPNMWSASVGAFLADSDFKGPLEGRADGAYGEHPKFGESPLEDLFVTAVAGAQTNTGFRDSGQLHRYSSGEFGPRGLYHCTLRWFPEAQGGEAEGNAEKVEVLGTTRGIEVRFHPLMPLQHEINSLWTYDGTFPPKIHCARYGAPHVLRIYNLLPIDPSANRGFGIHTTTTHEHNGHNGSTTDGFLNSFFFPGQYYDYSWRMTLDGHDTISGDPKAQGIDREGRPRQLPGDSREIMSSHWFHDHMADYTSQNTYKGMVAVMNYYSAIDDGNENSNNGYSLRLPSGSELPWANRDYDINLILADKAWAEDGSLWYNPFQSDGFLGDFLLTNWQFYPYLDVRARRYRFRLLNAGVARMLKIALVVWAPGGEAELPGEREGQMGGYALVPFWMVANDGNLLEHAVNFDGSRGTQRGILPVMSVAERYDIVVDFAPYGSGAVLYFVNVAEHKTGKRQEGSDVSLADILGGGYAARAFPESGEIRGDPCVGKFLELRVHEMDPAVNGGVDHSMDPARYEVGGGVMIPINRATEQEIRHATHRHFTFVKTAAEKFKWAIVTDREDGGDLMRQTRVSAAPRRESVEVWHLQNNGSEWVHGVHVHFSEGLIMLRDGGLPPIWEQMARKDVYRIGGGHRDGSTNLVFVIRWRDYTGHYMAHCHLTSHEDSSMLLRFDLEDPEVVDIMATPYPTWYGVKFLPSFGKPTFRTGTAAFTRAGLIEEVVSQLRDASAQEHAFLVHGQDVLTG
jgi:FtsP/CotA-like multicopper oxidase with cupredoxin domain